MRLLEQYKKLHEDGRFPGMSILPYVPEIADLIAEFKSRSLLDYGCGRGRQYLHERIHRAMGVDMPALYDPAVAEFSIKPRGPFEGVICTDVLEHVPEDELSEVIGDLSRYARQWAFITVCCRPSKHFTFEDGTNVHVTLTPFEW